MTVRVVSFEQGDAALDWLALTDAFAAGHLLPKAQITDSFLYRADDTALNRAAWIDGLGLAVKSATIFPGNRQVASINGGVTLYSDRDGTLEALIDFHLVTKWKTAADSLFAARRLARKDATRILIIGAGTVARSVLEAYGAGFPQAQFEVWNRDPSRAEALAAGTPRTKAVADLERAVGAADIIVTCTMSRTPVLQGSWLAPGTHIDLIGAYRPDMREADDTALTRARVFVDSRETTLAHIGELRDPLARGILSENDIVADFYDPTQFRRNDADEITLCKNGGGAHLDLMTARHILERVTA